MISKQELISRLEQYYHETKNQLSQFLTKEVANKSFGTLYKKVTD